MADASGDPLVFSLEDGAFTRWSAQYGSDGGSLQVLDQGGESGDPDLSSPGPLGDAYSFVEFDKPPPGDWTLLVQVFFANGGDATYGWHVIVE